MHISYRGAVPQQKLEEVREAEEKDVREDGQRRECS